MAVATQTPTVSVRIGESTCAFDVGGEIIATEDYDESGHPLWESGGIADHRGAGGQEGFRLLHEALDCLEANAAMCGYEVTRLPREE